MRLITTAIACAAMLCVTSAAGAAVTFSTSVSVESGRTMDALVPGDVITIDVTLRSDGQGTLAIGAAASGYDTDVVSFSGGQTSSAVLVQVCIPAVGCFGGIGNVAANLPLAEAVDPAAGPFVQFLTAVSLTPNVFTGESDPGIVSGVPGEAQFRLVFTAVGPGSTQIIIGARPEFGNAVVLADGTNGVSNDTTVYVPFVGPEPGTALLLGLGLAALSSTGRRRSSCEPERQSRSIC